MSSDLTQTSPETVLPQAVALSPVTEEAAIRTFAARRATSPPVVPTGSSAATPTPDTEAELDYLPARMLNAFVYCPRLFYYEHVEGIFAHNQETLDGAAKHARIDAGTGELPVASELPPDEHVHSRSVTLSSEQYKLIAKMDLVEASGDVATPVDYKRGYPREGLDGQPTAWDPERVQIAVQALVLRDNGYRCDEGVIYYVSTKQRVRVVIDEALLDLTLRALQQAREVAARGVIPPPLEASPKCPRCSLVGICLPDETVACNLADAESRPRLVQNTLFAIEEPPLSERPASLGQLACVGEEGIRRLLPARDDLRPLYLSTQGLRVGKSGNVLKIYEKDTLVQEVRMNEICQLNVFGNIQLSTQAIQTLCENELPIAYFSMGGWFYGVTHGLGVRNIVLRKQQFRWAQSPTFCLRLARAIVAGKIRNQRTMLQRNHIEPPRQALNFLKCLIDEAENAPSLDVLLGIEGTAARVYFENFAGMIKVESEADVPDHRAKSPFEFNFMQRNRRPPRDPVNALLSLAYSVLSKDLTIVSHMVGFDPYLGFYHQPRFGRAALALDLMEPFRPLIADSAVLSAINTRMITPGDFVQAGQSVALKPQGRKVFFRAYEQRMDTLVTHPLFGYRVNYRRVLEIQARLLARVLTGELTTYPVFVTR